MKVKLTRNNIPVSPYGLEPGELSYDQIYERLGWDVVEFDMDDIKFAIDTIEGNKVLVGKVPCIVTAAGVSKTDVNCVCDILADIDNGWLKVE